MQLGWFKKKISRHFAVSNGNNLINENNFEALNNLLSQILFELSLACRKKIIYHNNRHFQSFRCNFSKYSHVPNQNFIVSSQKKLVIKLYFMPTMFVVWKILNIAVQIIHKILIFTLNITFSPNMRSVLKMPSVLPWNKMCNKYYIHPFVRLSWMSYDIFW